MHYPKIHSQLIHQPVAANQEKQDEYGALQVVPQTSIYIVSTSYYCQQHIFLYNNGLSPRDHRAIAQQTLQHKEFIRATHSDLILS